MFFVNLNLRKVYADQDVLTRFLARGVNPELGLDPVLMDMAPASWHRELAKRLDDEGLRASLHLPFFDLQPGSADELVRQASQDRLARAMDVARVYRPAHLVGHARYDHLLYMFSHAQWLERSTRTWSAALAAWPGHPPLYLENTFEPDPSTVAAVAAALRERGENAGLCLDMGHWHSFAGGRERDNLGEWLDAFAPLLGHLHLHDNDGSFDQHRGLGQGDIPWQAFFTGLAQRGLTPSVTFEPHTDEAFEAAMEFVARRPEWFSPLKVAWAHAS